MSDVFEMQEEGILCSVCCGYVGNAVGFMTFCESCTPDVPKEFKSQKGKDNE
jgi:hypothetical protein